MKKAAIIGEDQNVKRASVSVVQCYVFTGRGPPQKCRWHFHLLERYLVRWGCTAAQLTTGMGTKPLIKDAMLSVDSNCLRHTYRF